MFEWSYLFAYLLLAHEYKEVWAKGTSYAEDKKYNFRILVSIKKCWQFFDKKLSLEGFEPVTFKLTSPFNLQLTKYLWNCSSPKFFQLFSEIQHHNKGNKTESKSKRKVTDEHVDSSPKDDPKFIFGHSKAF